MSRLGTQLRAPDGRLYQSGTEYEVNTAIASYRQRGSPDVLVYHNQTPAQIRRSPREVRERAYRQLEALEEFLDKLALDPETQSIRGAFTAYTNLAEFEERLEQHLRKLIVARAGEHAHDEGTAAPPPAVAWNKNPFRGLELFEFEHAAIFFGRTEAIGDVSTFSLADGMAIWHQQFPAKTVEADPVAADLDGDGVPDVLLAGYNSELRAINGLGTGIAKPLPDIALSPR